MNVVRLIVLVLAIAGTTYAVDCSSTQQITCAGAAGLAVTDLICLQSAPATCTQVICNVSAWSKIFTCLNAIPCTTAAVSLATCQSTYQVCSATIISQLCASSATSAASTAPAATTAAPSSAACTDTQVGLCTTATFSVTELSCFSTPATCPSSVCSASRWATVQTCINRVPCTRNILGTKSTCQSSFVSCNATAVASICAAASTPALLLGAAFALVVALAVAIAM